ncbi:hypothetical protein BZG02_20035 [Labilibaculum filiforme]|uniref:Uncharacterized protein n=1 Tax=Labilibaculum filiforme TaxID=1940526 RepID=A0A2N3HQG7_9BACT|nr:hypothetical protein [Labilibaculum filiforme]PKQ60291.1 hypothetical protein BZG02_20035 [Labilibaculum filiforme]
MYKTDICSPPLSIETRLFNIPGGELEDIFFTFNFNIQKLNTKDEITFTLDLNPSLCKEEVQSSPPAEFSVETYKFEPSKQCLFEHNTPEGFYVKGIIKIISFNNPIGQFDENRKNFLFDISTGHNDNTPHDIKGLFALIDPSSSLTDL